MEATVNAVVRGKNITEQSEVDAMAKAIEDAIAACNTRGLIIQRSMQPLPKQTL